jgi:hypothetical protein
MYSPLLGIYNITNCIIIHCNTIVIHCNTNLNCIVIHCNTNVDLMKHGVEMLHSVGMLHVCMCVFW